MRLLFATFVLSILFLPEPTWEEKFKTFSPKQSVAQAAQPLTDRRYIITLNEQLPMSVKDFIQKTFGQQLKTFDFPVTITYVYEETKGFVIDIPLKVQSAKLSSFIRRIESIPGVILVEADRLIGIEETQTDPPWGLDRIDQPYPAPSHTYTYNVDGSGINVYVFDTGMRITHQEFGGRAAVGYDAIDDDGSPNTPTFNDRSLIADGLDCQGHGTHVAGIVGGANYGVAKRTTLVSVRVIGRASDGSIYKAGCGTYGRTTEIIDAIQWVNREHRQQRKPSIVNMSIGERYSESLNEHVERSVAAGLIYTVAAGNQNTDLSTRSPASARGVIPVGAIEVWDRHDHRWNDSNFGCNIIFAPGSAIISACHRFDTDSCEKEGTSMAAPHVAGVVALYLQTNRSASPEVVFKVIRDNATAGMILDPGPNSGNLLVFSGFVK